MGGSAKTFSIVGGALVLILLGVAVWRGRPSTVVEPEPVTPQLTNSDAGTRTGVSTPTPRTSAPSHPSTTPGPAPESEPDQKPSPTAVDCSWSWTKFKFDCGDCQSDADCKTGTSCALDTSTRRLTCMKNECTEDADCPSGKVCKMASAGTSVGNLVNRCSEPGVLSEGQSCVEFPHRPETACAPGLGCAERVCGRLCTPGDATTCPAGFTCSATADGKHACFDSCGADNPCPEGSSCITMGDRSICRVVTEGPNCLDPDMACPADRSCTYVRGERGMAFRCQQCCNPLVANSCTEQGVCGRAPPSDGKCESVCFQKCGPKVGGCPQGYTCTTVNEELSIFGCVQTPP